MTLLFDVRNALGSASRCFIVLLFAGIGPVFAAPTIFTSSNSARSGDIIYVQGDSFGNEGEVWLDGIDGAPATKLDVVNRVGTTWMAVQVPPGAQGALLIRVRDEDGGISAPFKLNAATPLHLDATRLTPGGAFRLFGRNLLLRGYSPVVTVNGAAAAINIAASDEHMLVLTAPPKIAPASKAVIAVDNGNGTGPATLDRAISVEAGSGDPMGLGVGWAAVFDFTSIVIPANPPTDGKTDGSQAIQDALNAAGKSGGGVVQLPAGTIRLSGTSLWIPNRVILRGAGRDQTILRYESNYPVWSVYGDVLGMCDLTLINSDTSPVEHGPVISRCSRVFFKDIRINSGTSRQLIFGNNTDMVVTDCEFIQLGTISGQGPYYFNESFGLVFTNNVTRWAYGSPHFNTIHDSIISNNTFLRDASVQFNTPKDRDHVHSLVLGFAHRIAVVGNRLDVVNGPLTNKDRNDGEAILTEGGGPRSTENLGTATGAGPATLTDVNNTIDVNPLDMGLVENFGVTIVGGKGTGQIRRITGYANSTLTVDPPWDVIPDTASRYTTFVWGLEKTLIKNNTLRGNPRSIWLYQTGIREVDVIGNTIEEGGGIYVRSWQDVAHKKFTPIYNVKIAGNFIRNTTGNWASYITIVSVSQNREAFGTSLLGIEVRDNQVFANQPNIITDKEDYCQGEGFTNWIKDESPKKGGGYLANDTPRILGTIFQRNLASFCEVGFRLGTGADGTVLADNKLVDTPEMWTDTRVRPGAPLAAKTVVLPKAAR